MSTGSKSHCTVLGGAGFLGAHLMRALLAQGHRVRCFDLRKPTDADLLGNPRLETVVGEFVNTRLLSEAVGGTDVCYHLVSTTLPESSHQSPVFDIQSNLLGTINLLEAGRASGLKKIIFASSGGTVYGRPQQVPISEDHPTEPVVSYGIVKLAIEKYLGYYQQQHGIDATVLRLANPYGEGQRIDARQGAVAVFLGKVLRGEPIEIWGDGSVVRDFLHVADVTRAMMLAGDYRGRPSVFNIGSGHGTSLRELLAHIETACGRAAQVNYLPGRSFDVPNNVLDIGLASRHLHWKPAVSLEDGLARFVRYLNQAQ